MKHTPAPWTAHGDLVMANGDHICEVHEGANAALIAAAPELLEALESLVKAERTGCNLDFAMRRAADAIAKAGGAE